MLFVLSTVLIGTAFAAGNQYSFVLSALIFIVLALLAVLSRTQAIRLKSSTIEWDTSKPVYARQRDDEHRVSIRGFKTLPFFRVHFILHGRLQAGRDASLHYHREISGTGEAIYTGIMFPLSGVFHALGAVAVKDIFGLTRGARPPIFEKSIVVRPAPLAERERPRVEAQKGDENKSRLKNSDVERYYMREYIPGDRHRDINWKASSRFSELFTRISPVTQENTKIITVHFRPYTSMKSDSLRSVFYLDHCKSSLLYFLRAVNQEHSEYQFAVHLGNDIRELDTPEDIDSFATEIAATHYLSPRGEEITSPDDLHPGNVFVFTTAYDTGLAGFLAGKTPGTPAPGAQTRVYRSAIPPKDRRGVEVKRLTLVSGTEEPAMTGRWVLRRDPLSVNPPVGDGIILEDDPLEVRVV